MVTLRATLQAISKQFHVLRRIRKTSDLGSLRFEGEQNWASFIRRWTTAQASKKDWFFIESLYVVRNRFIIAIQREQYQRDCLFKLLRHQLVRTFRLRRLSCVFVRPRSLYLSWAGEAERNHFFGTVSSAVQAMKQSTAQKAATKPTPSTKSYKYGSIQLLLALFDDTWSD